MSMELVNLVVTAVLLLVAMLHLGRRIDRRFEDVNAHVDEIVGGLASETDRKFERVAETGHRQVRSLDRNVRLLIDKLDAQMHEIRVLRRTVRLMVQHLETITGSSDVGVCRAAAERRLGDARRRVRRPPIERDACRGNQPRGARRPRPSA